MLLTSMFVWAQQGSNLRLTFLVREKPRFFGTSKTVTNQHF